MDMPVPETYEAGLQYWPYRLSLAKVLEAIQVTTLPGATVLDIMCGPGYLLGQLCKAYPSLRLTGVDIEEQYIDFGRRRYPNVSFEVGDVCTWRSTDGFSTVVCTGALHHVPYGNQGAAIRNISRMVKPGGVVIISDCYVDEYANETERRLAAAKLGDAYLRETIRAGAPPDVLAWTADITKNDVCGEEFKPCLRDRVPLLGAAFKNIQTFRVWPEESGTGYGDYIHICGPC